MTKSEIERNRLETLKNFKLVRQNLDLKMQTTRLETLKNFELVREELQKETDQKLKKT